MTLPIPTAALKQHIAFLGKTGSGKALALDTPLPTPTGWTTMGEVAVGDTLFDENGKPCKVTFATEVQHGRECFAVRFADGSEIVADADHIWLSETNQSRIAESNVASSPSL
jgi:replicative DNA helicase